MEVIYGEEAGWRSQDARTRGNQIFRLDIQRRGGTIRPGPVELSTAPGELASGVATGPRPGEVVQPSTTSATTRGPRRVPRSLDFLTPENPLDRHTLLASCAHAAAHFHLELAEAKIQLGGLKAASRFGASRLATEKGRFIVPINRGQSIAETTEPAKRRKEKIMKRGIALYSPP